MSDKTERRQNDSSVRLGIDKQDVLSILRTAASKERCVIEFRTDMQSGERTLSTAIEITDHVEALEDDSNETRQS
jgi:hypothetical protein